MEREMGIKDFANRLRSTKLKNWRKKWVQKTKKDKNKSKAEFFRTLFSKSADAKVRGVGKERVMKEGGEQLPGYTRGDRGRFWSV